ncbi:MAG: hypothetical protein Faunusvirus20_13 [Faunusvirus sp.]|jgi:hypothetical protein|uniref:Uncharacterized protein n=1 Tax=Faunusvirus sp. TaxID=2487766 RepID=A0A3G4ZXF5_9VIRU|nr:MAG: hypothetical protein Faunusvirus20_13 [Faunusvirus sp.]
MTIHQEHLNRSRKDMNDYMAAIILSIPLLLFSIIGFAISYQEMHQNMRANDQINTVKATVANYTIYNSYCIDNDGRQYICYRGDVIIDNYCIFNKISADTYYDIHKYLTANYPINSNYTINYNAQTGVCGDKTDIGKYIFATWFTCALMIIFVIAELYMICMCIKNWRIGYRLQHVTPDKYNVQDDAAV